MTAKVTSRKHSVLSLLEGQAALSPTVWIKAIDPIRVQVNMVDDRFTNPDVVPGHKALIASHEQAATVLIGNRIKASSGGGGDIKSVVYSPSGAFFEGSWITGTFGQLSGPFVPGDISTLFPSLQNRALTGYTKKLIAAQRSLQTLVSLGELGETVRGIRRPLKALWEGIFEYSKRAERNARRAARRLPPHSNSRRKAVQDALTGTYLETVFGWLPLLGDIDSASKALARTVIYRPPSEIVRFQTGDSRQSDPLIQQRFIMTSMNLRSVWTDQYNGAVRFYGSIVNRNGWNGALQEFGLSSWTEFAPAIWELIPYSFVADYFTNIGNIIDAAAFNSAGVKWTCVGTRMEHLQIPHGSIRINALPASPFRVDVRTRLGIDMSSSAVQVKRQPYTGSLIPSLEFTIPGLGMRWLNLGALASQLFSTSRRIARL